MPMANDITLVGAAVLGFLPLMFILPLVIRRWLRRDHVYAEVDVPDGRTRKFHQKPDAKGDLHFLKGTYHTMPGAFTMVNAGTGLGQGRLFRYVKGSGWPLVPRLKAMYEVIPAKADEATKGAANGGSPITVRKLTGYEAYFERQVVPAEAEEVFFKQHLFADAYSGRGGLLLVLLIGLFLLGILVVGLYYVRG